jgi:hypothetical protein
MLPGRLPCQVSPLSLWDGCDLKKKIVIEGSLTYQDKDGNDVTLGNLAIEVPWNR